MLSPFGLPWETRDAPNGIPGLPKWLYSMEMCLVRRVCLMCLVCLVCLMCMVSWYAWCGHPAAERHLVCGWASNASASNTQ